MIIDMEVLNPGKPVPKILLVDDNPDNLKALEVTLRGLDAVLVKVTNGNDALKATLHHDFALALLDIQMPEMDGYELANILKTEEKTENLPFIFISAVFTDHKNVTKGYAKGAFNFFAKPFDPETLVRSVALFLEKYNQAQEKLILNEKLKKRSEELEEKNELLISMNTDLESFAHVASHDLQEPLRKIQIYSQYLVEQEGGNLSENAKIYSNKIQTAATRMRALINDLLGYSRTNHSNQIYQDIDLNEMMSSVEDDFRDCLDEKRGRVIYDNLGKIRVVPFQFRQLLHNLISNSLKYASTEREPVIEITRAAVSDDDGGRLKLKGPGPFCRIAVSDNGIGFDPVYNEKIFGMFERLHGNETYSGTGIGLALVKKIIENHNGTIVASGTKGHGSVFHIYLPI